MPGISRLSISDLDVRDPRTALLDPSAIAEALRARPAHLAALGSCLLNGTPGQDPAGPWSFDEALAVVVALRLAMELGSDRVGREAVRRGWPEIVRAILDDREKPASARTGMAVLVGGALTSPVHVEPWCPAGPPPPLCVVLDLAPTVLVLRGLLPAGVWDDVCLRLNRLFGRGSVDLPTEGRAHDMPTGTSFLSEGPYWDRLTVLLRAELPRTGSTLGSATVRRLAWYVRYLLHAPPIDQWKMEVGTAKALPRVKHLVEVIAEQRGIDWEGERHPDTVRAAASHEPVATLLDYLDRLGRPASMP